MKCLNCDQEGHLEGDCPNIIKGQRESQVKGGEEKKYTQRVTWDSTSLSFKEKQDQRLKENYLTLMTIDDGIYIITDKDLQ